MTVKNDSYSFLDFVQDTGDAIGYMAASLDNTSNFSRVANLANATYEVMNAKTHQGYGEKIVNNFDTSSKVCNFIQFYDFFNYIISGQCVEDAHGGSQGIINLLGRVAFFGADASVALKMGIEVVHLFGETISPVAFRALGSVADGFAVVGFSLSLVSTIQDCVEINRNAKKQTKENIIKVSLEFSDTLLGLASTVTSIACATLGITTMAVPALLAISMTVGLVKSAYSTYYNKHYPEKGVGLVQNPWGAGIQKASGALNKMTQSSESLNQASKLVNGMVGAYDYLHKGFADNPAVCEINGACKQYSGDLGFTAVAKRISEAVTRNERGTYDWMEAKNDLKTTKMFWIFGANCVDAATYLGENAGLNLDKVNDKVVGDLKRLSLAKSMFIGLSIIFGTADSSVKIHQARRSKASRDLKLSIWKNIQIQMNNQVANPGSGQVNTANLSSGIIAELTNSPGGLKAQESVENVARASISKKLNKLRSERGKARREAANKKNTRAVRMAAANREKTLNAQMETLKGNNINLQAYVANKVARFEAKKYNDSLAINKNALAIFNDFAKAAIVGLIAAGSAMKLRENMLYKASVVTIGLAAGLISVIKTLYDSCNPVRKVPVFAGTSTAPKSTGWSAL